MFLNTNTLSQALPTVVDRRRVKSPWSAVPVDLPDGTKAKVELLEGALTFELEIFRQGRYVGSKQPFQDWVKRNAGSNPFFKALLKVSFDVSEAKGARKRRGGSRAGRGDLISQAIDKADLSETEARQAIADLKPGIAEHLMGQWWGVLTADNEPAPSTLEARLDLLANPKTERGMLYLPPKLTVKVRGYDVEVDVPYAGDHGLPIGDAIADWIFDESEADEAFFYQTVVEAGELFGDTPGSGSGAGPSSQESSGSGTTAT